MKLLSVIFVCLLLFAGSAMATDRTAVCEGCGEFEYSQSALRAAPVGGVVLVVDMLNGNLRKFSVDLIEDFDGGSLEVIVIPLTPTQAEFNEFFDVEVLTDKYYNPTIESCGPGLVGELGIIDFDFGWACDAHDDCYAVGGDEQDRAACDLDLYFDIMMSANWILAGIFRQAVNRSGWMFFNYGGNGGNPLDDGCAYLEVCEWWDEQWW